MAWPGGAGLAIPLKHIKNIQVDTHIHIYTQKQIYPNCALKCWEIHFTVIQKLSAARLIVVWHSAPMVENLTSLKLWYSDGRVQELSVAIQTDTPWRFTVKWLDRCTQLSSQLYPGYFGWQPGPSRLNSPERHSPCVLRAALLAHGARHTVASWACWTQLNATSMLWAWHAWMRHTGWPNVQVRWYSLSHAWCINESCASW